MTTFDPSALPDFAQRQEAARLYEAYYAAWAAELDAEDDDAVSDEKLAAMVTATKAARDAYDDCPGPVVMTDADDRLVRCAASGAPLWRDDEVVCDDWTGEVFLRAALGLPPRPVKQELPEPEEVA